MIGSERVRIATCQCGQLSATCRGEPVRVSACHCLDCQRRSGAPFALQARFPSASVTVSGEANCWERTAESGNTAEHHFCPVCGSTLWYHLRPHRDLYAIPVGAFADPQFPPPAFSVWEARTHPWVKIDVPGIERHD